ncbi:G patch domain-containing protein 11 [Sitodiplosis mosellana]|uniref:G patch domain-containing protein 11 n=1 Tax=Sitodiplosis mosellana TaxID=263140 RepID=UPI00244496EB|nr:G patch domain-containing protein 11 [Sitodiplosis mosellana]
MSGSSEEDDYMSDAFLAKTIETDVRPGLVCDHKIARRLKLEEEKQKLEDEQKVKQKPVRQLEAERREEGLSAAISSDNKGFAMLAKMGYKQGDAIGRSSSGIVEPISIQVKSNRAGLGRETAIKQLEEYKERLRKAKSEQNTETSTTSLHEFRQRMAQKNVGKQLEADLCKCQRACEKLDLDASIETPIMAFFWPVRKTGELTETQEDPYDENVPQKPKKPRKESTSSEDSEKPSTKHFGFMPGSSSESSSSESEEEEPTRKIEEIPAESINDEEDEYETSEKVEMLTTYLRTTYTYCHWCGTHYQDVDDMDSNCPGTTKDEH